MGVRFTEAWGGNRVYKGSAWMELYYAVDGELNGDPAWSLTGNGKIPNSMTSVFLVLHIVAVFDSNTQDNSNTFIQNGAHWPGYSGSVSIPTVREKGGLRPEIPVLAWLRPRLCAGSSVAVRH